MKKQQKPILVLAMITAFIAVDLFLPVLISAGEVRFNDLGNGTVQDSTTGLIWLKDANCFGRMFFDAANAAAASLASGQCGLTDGSTAGDWRLPTKEEWQAFIDTNYTNPVLSNAAGTNKWSQGDAFDNVGKHKGFWSSTTSVDSTSVVWYVNMGDGLMGKLTKRYNVTVWPVRDGN
jgi:hypothetical protein